jgi:hypothetical protein
MPRPTPEDERDADSLLSTGWRQASVFRPPAGTEVPVHGGFDPETEFLVICTQSCNLVSSSFDNNPQAEVLIGKPISKYNERSFEATGRNARTFHMQVEGDGTVQAIACDVARRGFLPRHLLLECQRSGLVINGKAARSFAGWLSRYYGRAAFPNELVRRAKAGRLFNIIEQALCQTDSFGRPLNEGVQYVYVHLSTYEELREDDGSHYIMRMFFLCREPEVVDQLDRLLIAELDAYDGGAIRNGLSFTYDVRLTSQIFVSELDDYVRFPEWDYLSGLKEARDSYASPLPET